MSHLLTSAHHCLLAVQDMNNINLDSLLHIIIEKNNFEILNCLITLKDTACGDVLTLLSVGQESFEEIKNTIQNEVEVTANKTIDSLQQVEILEGILKNLCLLLSLHTKISDKNIHSTTSSVTTELDRYEVVFRVGQAGNDMNSRLLLYGRPLQVAQEYSEAVHYFVSKELYSQWENVARRTAVERRYLETVCTNPCCNNVNIGKYLGYTLFSYALQAGNVRAQDALYEHYSDTVSSLDLMLALEFNSPYATAILQKNVKVDKSFLNFCFLDDRPFNEHLIRQLWLKIECDENDPLQLDIIFEFNLNRDCIEKMLNIIIESENTDMLLNYASTLDSLECFMTKFYDCECSIDLLAKLIYRLLQCSYILHFKDIYNLFHYYGYCNLIKSLLYMEYRHDWYDCDNGFQLLIMPRFMLDIHSSKQTIEQDFLKRFTTTLLERSEFQLDIKHYFECFCNRRLMLECGYNDYGDILSNVPKLVELTRNESREFIVKAFNISATCQYYKVIDQLDIPEVCKSILKYEQRLYQVNL